MSRRNWKTAIAVCFTSTVYFGALAAIAQQPPPPPRFDAPTTTATGYPSNTGFQQTSQRPNYPNLTNPQMGYPQPSYPQPTYPQANYPQPNYPQPNTSQLGSPQSAVPDASVRQATAFGPPPLPGESQPLPNGYGYTPPAAAAPPIPNDSRPGPRRIPPPPVGATTNGQFAPGMNNPPAWQPPPAAPQAVAPPYASRPPARRPAVELYKPSQIVAWVGDQPIQAGDILPIVDQALAPKLAAIPPEELEKQKDQIEELRNQWMEQALGNFVESKLMYLDFLRSIPADKRDEALPEIMKRAEEQFYEKQLPIALEKAEVNSAAELDAKLREFGSSLAKQRRTFIERALGQSAVGQKIEYQPEITHADMLDYYHEHAADYETKARARWEKLTVLSVKFPSKQEAWAAIGQMGNEVLRGAPFPAVAKRHSQGTDAADGGYHDWTTQGSLVSEIIDDAIFALPINQLSERIEDEEGFHILRVIEREDAGRVPFVEAQVEIKEKLRQEKVKQQIKDYVDNLRKEIHVWTIFDDQTDSTDGATSTAAAGAPRRQ